MTARPLTVIATMLIATAAGAQAPAATISIRVHVTNDAGAPVSGAEVTAVRSIASVAASGVTDDRGDHIVTVARIGQDIDIVVRRIGYQRVDRFFNDSTAPPVIDVKLVRAAQSLDAVKVNADADPTRKSYFIDADAIEHAPRVIGDGLDVVMKLRPDMILGRAGRPDQIFADIGSSGRRHLTLNQLLGDRRTPASCPPPAVSYVWINGERVRDGPENILALQRRVGTATAINATVARILASVHPEHIAEMEFVPCDAPPPKDPVVGSTNAIYIKLKSGVAWEATRGSYVQSQASMPEDASAGIPRLLGVFDEVTGSALAGVKIIDSTTGLSALTTETGTATLAFLPLGPRQLRIEKEGYLSQTIPLNVSPVDTIGVTVMLKAAKP